MNKFEIDGKRIQRNTYEQLLEEFFDITNYYRNIFTNQIKNCIYEEMRGIEESKLEDWIEVYLILEIKNAGKKAIDKIEQILDESFLKLNYRIKNTSNIDQIINEYQETFSRILNSDNDFGLEYIYEEFINELSKKIAYYYDAFYGMSNHFEEKLIEIKSALKRLKNKHIENFMYEYNDMIKKCINKNFESMTQNVKNKNPKERKLRQVEFNLYKIILKYNNFTLYEENNEYYIKDDSTQEITNISLKNGFFIDENEKIVIQIKDRTIYSLNRETGIMFIYRNEQDLIIKVNLTNNQKEIIAKIVHLENGLKIIYKENECKTSEEIIEVLNVIKELFPGYYNLLIKDKYITELINSSNDKNQLENNTIDYIDPKKQK